MPAEEFNLIRETLAHMSLSLCYLARYIFAKAACLTNYLE